MQLVRSIVQQLPFLQGLLSSAQPNSSRAVLVISEQWHVLGPFTIGTREATWGADPLESIGGFHSLDFNKESRFRSTLTANGTIGWTTTIAQVTSLEDVVNVELQVAFPEIDWTFMQQVYGWAALQWQGWARGYLTITSDEVLSYNLNLERILELRIDDEHYFGGDFYGFHKAPLLLRLSPGRHEIDIRLVRDVRSMGGITSSPSIDARLLLTRTTNALRQDSQVLYPDRVADWKGPLSSSYASVILRNDNDTDVFIHSLEASHNICQTQLVSPVPIRLMPGQSRPVAFQIDCIQGTSAYLSVDLHFGYYADAYNKYQHTLSVGILALPPVSMHEPQILTYLHPAGIVSYAVIRPPPPHCSAHERLPVLLALHGAGVIVDSAQSKHALDDVADVCAWMLMPSGVTSWSGNDWHSWGWADVEAAVEAISAWIDKVEWSGPGVDTMKWLVVGHSNGGQGVWYALTHHPDRIIAAAPVSGYSSIQNYVPYTFWQPADSTRSAVIQSQLDNYRHELLLANAKGIPILQQHGSIDDNVPAYHSRLMYNLVHQSGSNSTYVELPGRPHWWEGVLTTPPLEQFYRQHLATNGTSLSSSRTLGNFSVITANPGDTGSKNGLRIRALTTPGQLGRVHVAMRDGQAMSCHIRTENVDSFELGGAMLRECREIFVDANIIDSDTIENDASILVRAVSGAWTISHTRILDPCSRTDRQHGGLEAILRTNGTFHIFSHSPGTTDLALQVANNLMQYYSADVEIATQYQDAIDASGNVISLIHGAELPFNSVECTSACAFDLDKHGQMVIKKDDQVLRSFNIADNDIVAAAFLRPLPGHRLELIFWAIDLFSLSISTRLLPLLTGSGQPDFVIATRGMLHLGLEGVVAMGYLDSSWCPASTSFFATGEKV